MKLIIFLLFIFQSCTLKVGPSIKSIKLEKDTFNTIKYNPKPKVSRTFESKDCAQIYFIFPNKLKTNLTKILQNSCKEDEVLIDAQLYDTFYYIPLVYGEECIALKGKCAKI